MWPSIPRQLAASSVIILAVQGPHDPDPREHRRAVLVDDQKQGLDRILPFLDLLFGLRQLLDISGGILEGDELATAGQRYRIIERPFPALGCVYAKRSAPSCVNDR
jgi:hypothetical protein